MAGYSNETIRLYETSGAIQCVADWLEGKNTDGNITEREHMMLSDILAELLSAPYLEV